MFGQSIYLSFINLSGRACNFLLYFLIANKFGASNNTDWFFLVYALIYYITTIYFRSVESILVPLLNKHGLNSANIIFKITILTGIWSTFGIFLITCIIGFFLAPMYLGIESPEHYSLRLTVCFILCVQPSLALYSSFFSSYLQACQKYTLPTIQLSIRSLGILSILILPWCKSILCLAFAYLIGELTRLTVLGKLTLTEIAKHKAINTTEPLTSGDIFRRTGWIALALCSAQLNPAIDMAMVGGLGEGSATLVSYAEKLRGFPILAINGIVILLLGEWSKQHQKDGITLTFQRVVKTTILFLSISALFTIILIIFKDIWLPAVFFSNNFNEEEIKILTKLFTAYAPGIPFLTGFLIASNALIVYQKTKILALIAVMSMGLNIPLNLLLLEHYGLVGVAYSTTCLDCIAFLIVLASVKRVSSTFS